MLYANEDDAGESYLGRYEESKAGERRKWGIGQREPSSLALVRDITRLLALTGPTASAAGALRPLPGMIVGLAIAPSVLRMVNHHLQGNVPTDNRPE